MVCRDTINYLRVKSCSSIVEVAFSTVKVMLAGRNAVLVQKQDRFTLPTNGVEHRLSTYGISTKSGLGCVRLCFLHRLYMNISLLRRFRHFLM